MEKEFVESDDEKIYFHIQRKNIKNMNFVVGKLNIEGKYLYMLDLVLKKI